MDMKKAFVGLGIGVLVVTGLIQSGVVDVNEVFTTGGFAPGVELANKTLDEKWGGSAVQGQSIAPATDNQGTTPQSAYDKNEWVKVKEKTCEVAWNNADFKDGWCKLYRFPPGEYRFKVRSSLKDTHTDGGSWNYPPEGIPTSRWRTAGAIQYADFFEQWSPIKNKMIGMIIFKIDDEYPLSTWDISISQPQIISMSINFPATQENWNVAGFHGKITIEVIKKKT
jgi:hypothetical protein